MQVVKSSGLGQWNQKKHQGGLLETVCITSASEDPWPAQLPNQPKLPVPVQDLSLAQVVNKLGMARVRLTHAKEVMVVDSSKATKIKVGLKQNISDS